MEFLIGWVWCGVFCGFSSGVRDRAYDRNLAASVRAHIDECPHCGGPLLVASFHALDGSAGVALA